MRARGAASHGGRSVHAVHGSGAIRSRPAGVGRAGPGARGPGARRAAGGPGAAVRGVLRAAVRRGGHRVPGGRAGRLRVG